MATAETSERRHKTEFEETAAMGVYNSPEQIAEHKRITEGKTRTRFPPEPNGYLHIGHAKALYMNFKGAFEKLGVDKDHQFVFFRYDDTNPEAESQEYIDSIAEFVRWMGWTPSTTTFASDYFQELYDLAVKLIKKGKAYICHQTKAEIEHTREVAKARLKAIAEKTQDPSVVPSDLFSPWRDRPVEENLRLFEEMKCGMWDEGTISLRMKMDMLSPNPNMWDSVAYRIKFSPHPHAGDGWCIYPTYDYTHCINDALEHIDYSCCTLEFQTRRESYYWLLRELDLWQPNVYESARLELEYAMLSKRKIQKLVQNGMVRGWDDPRLATLAGLRRRGYTPEILNTFCHDIGITRMKSCIEIERLEQIARRILGETCPRAFAVLDPLKVVITNLDRPEPRPVSEGLGAEKRSLTLTPVIYIERSDFSLTPDESFFGLGPNREVLLKYAYNFLCTEVVKDAAGNVTEIRGTIDRELKNKCKGTLHWLGGTPKTAEVRLYSYLFTVGNLGAPEHKDIPWEDLLNRNSEQVVPKALVESCVLGAPARTTFQFERLGYFTVDQDSKGDNAVFNRVITLRDRQEPAAKGSSRKEQQEQQLAAKQAMKSVKPEEMFLSQTDLYSKWDEQGIPTHDAAGEPLSKNAIKKLKTTWEKQKKAFESTSEGKADATEPKKGKEQAAKERKQSTNEPKEQAKKKEQTKPKEADKERKQSTNEPKEQAKPKEQERKQSTNEPKGQAKPSEPKEQANKGKPTETQTKELKPEPKQAQEKTGEPSEAKPGPNKAAPKEAKDQPKGAPKGAKPKADAKPK